MMSLKELPFSDWISLIDELGRALTGFAENFYKVTLQLIF